MDGAVTDAAVLDALVAAEAALTRAYGTLGAAPRAQVDAVCAALGWVGAGSPAAGHGIAPAEVAAAAVAGGNPVIPLVALLQARVPDDARAWVHRGATSQDILDSALMLVARRAALETAATLRRTGMALAGFAEANRDEVAAARTLTQHAVPTTLGLRAAAWLRGIERAAARVEEAALALPAQLGGAAGTLASFVEILGAEDASRLPVAFADELALSAPPAPWHTTRWPVTELGDALVQALDACGVLAADVATAARTEVGELTEGSRGASSAMPQKSNPTAAVLVRSAALRAPMLGATLHAASASACDERPDGAWHAEWPALRELLRLALGATAHAAALAEGLTVDHAAVARNVEATRGLLVAERLSLVLAPLLGRDAVARIVAAAAAGGDLANLVRDALPPDAGVDADALLDPAAYTGLAARLVDAAVTRSHREGDA
ncbi:lyase family protein [Demequina soli]|uniref:lyase family protein n=1 Tax=Demequina soli TaxID=1638987 RepID=UPI00078537A3|nr:lyase family protein [Demequina soli]